MRREEEEGKPGRRLTFLCLKVGSKAKHGPKTVGPFQASDSVYLHVYKAIWPYGYGWLYL
jgi:hypothetical protein